MKRPSDFFLPFPTITTQNVKCETIISSHIMRSKEEERVVMTTTIAGLSWEFNAYAAYAHGKQNHLRYVIYISSLAM